MKTAVIDIGSNSIRLLMPNERVKLIQTTQVAENSIHNHNTLQEEPIRRTIEAIVAFYNHALDNGADEVRVFATEAIRSARNKQEFVDRLLRYNIPIDILTPQQEALVGFMGASIGGKCTVFDVGGASTELIVGDNDKIMYSHSLPLGIVRLKDLCPTQDISILNKIIIERIQEYGTVPDSDKIIAIGGSSSTIAAILNGGYDRDTIHHQELNLYDIDRCLDILVNAKDKTLIKGLEPKRAGVIIGGILMCKNILKYLGKSSLIVSETDNIEGYLKKIK